MKKILPIILLFFSFSLKSQTNEKLIFERKKAVETLKILNKLYLKNDSTLTNYFTDKVECSICEEAVYENQYRIDKEKFIKKCLKDVIGYINFRKINANKIHFFSSKDENYDFSLSYRTAKPNKQTRFEGASAIIQFKKVGNIFKIYSIETIP